MLKDHSTLFLRCHPTDISTWLIIEIWWSRQEMEETPSFGTLINDHWRSRPSLTTNHGTSSLQEEPTTCKSGAPIQDGSKSSCMPMNISATSRIRNAWMLLEARMLKVKQFKYLAEIIIQIKSGRSFTKTKLTRLLLRDLIKNLVLKSIDLSTSSLICQWRELLNALEPTTWFLEDMSRVEFHNSTTSTVSQELLDHNNGRTMP